MDLGKWCFFFFLNHGFYRSCLNGWRFGDLAIYCYLGGLNIQMMKWVYGFMVSISFFWTPTPLKSTGPKSFLGFVPFVAFNRNHKPLKSKKKQKTIESRSNRSKLIWKRVLQVFPKGPPINGSFAHLRDLGASEVLRLSMAEAGTGGTESCFTMSRILGPPQVEVGKTGDGRNWWPTILYNVGPPSDVSWFINPINYSYKYHKP